LHPLLPEQLFTRQQSFNKQPVKINSATCPER
jgi:hypothetical protein